MKDERVDELLRALPKERAGEDFTSRLMDRLEGRTPSKTRTRLALSAAAAIVLVAVAAVGILWWQQADRAELRAQIEEMRAEYQALSAELRRMREQAAGVRPVLYLGGDDRRDYVLDLNNVDRGRHSIPIKYTGGPI